MMGNKHINKRYESIILLSGGVDSLIGYFYLGCESQPIYFNIGSQYTQKEINHLNKVQTILKQPIIYDNSLEYLGEYEDGIKAYIPYRNLFLALTATLKYSNKIYICGLKDDNVSDKNKDIFDMWSQTLSKTNNTNIQILSPFWNMTKVDIIKWFYNEYPQYDLNEYSLSCYSNDAGHCYSCPACFRRNTALFSIGIKLPFYNTTLIENYIINQNKYNNERRQYMLEYIKYLKS